MAVMSSKEEKERAAFENDMGVHVAQLMGFAKRYLMHARYQLRPKDREALLRDALELAWRFRENLGPVPLLQWWDKCLRLAAMKRVWWTLHYDYRRINISGRELGKVENV